MDGPIGGGVTSDADNPRRQIAAVGAGGLTMPSRDYYLADAEPYIGPPQGAAGLYGGLFPPRRHP